MPSIVFLIEDIYKTRLYLSATQFLSAEDNLEGRELVDANLVLRRAVKTIRVNVKPDASLENDALQSLKITKVELSVNNTGASTIVKPFYSGNTTVGLKNLASIVKDPGTEAYNDEETVKAFYTKFPVVWANAAASDKIETKVDVPGVNLTSDQDLRFYTLPYDGDVDKNKLIFKVYTQAGYFIVKYVASTDRYYNADVDAANNSFIEKLAKAYEKVGNTSGYLRNWDMEKAGENKTLKLEFILSADDFTPELQVIRPESEWNEAVRLVDAMGDKMENPIFTIGKTKSGSNWVKWQFKDIDNDGNLINLPANGVLTVQAATENGQSVVVNKAGAEWPNSEDFVVNNDIEVWDNLVVKGVMAVTGTKTVNGEIVAHRIMNGSTIYAGPLATIGTKPTSSTSETGFANRMAKNLKPDYTSGTFTGTVVVEYGAYVYPASGEKGVISYDVESTEVADIEMINKLINVDYASRFGFAGINTLNVKTELDINARAKYGVADEDRYGAEISSDELLADLSSGMTVNLQGGSLVNKLAGLNTTVAKVVAQSGENTIDNVVANNIEVNSGATLNVVNTKTTIKKTYFANGSIVNKGTLKLNNVDLVVTTVENKANATIDAIQGAIYYTTSNGYIQNGNVQGPVNSGNPTTIYTSTLSEFTDAVAKIKAGKGTTIQLAANLNLLPAYDNSGNETGYASFNLDGVKLNGNGFTVSTLNSVDKGVGQAVFTTNSGEIKNVVFNAPNTQYDIVVTNPSIADKTLTIDGCTFSTSTHYTMKDSDGDQYAKRSIYGSGLTANLTTTVKNSTFNNKGYAFNISNSDDASVIFESCTLNGWMSGVCKLTFVKCTFGKSGDYQDFIPYNTAEFNECIFNNGFAVSLKHADGKLTFKNSCKYGSETISAPHNVKWSFNGSGTAVAATTAREVKVGAKTWKSTNVAGTTVSNGTITWVQQ